jgi:6-phosphogluconolactonase
VQIIGQKFKVTVVIKIFSNFNDLTRFAAEKFIEIGTDSIERRGKCSVALAGGSTPKALYKMLADDEFKDKIDWRKVYFFFGDERNVLPDDDESNFKMARENLLQPLNIDDKNIFRWQTELLDAKKIAEDYQKNIIEFYELKEDEFPRFDLILLGMGDDGHTASLFPFSQALGETKEIAVANSVEKLDTIRLTLTFPVINNAANVIFLVKGADKAETLREVLEGKNEPQKYPSQSVKPREGDLYWLIESEAARLLTEI